MKSLPLTVQKLKLNKQTGQKQYAPDHSIRGHKKDELLLSPMTKVHTPTAPIQSKGTTQKHDNITIAEGSSLTERFIHIERRVYQNHEKIDLDANFVKTYAELH